MGCDVYGYRAAAKLLRFQFTHPVWGATTPPEWEDAISSSFNSRTPCGVRLRRDIIVVARFVSIHAPRVGCDLGIGGHVSSNDMFQFTHPVWGATIQDLLLDEFQKVSIHAPRVGCDPVAL